MRVLSLGLALAGLMAAGCNAGRLTNPSLKTTTSYAQIVAITLPESLDAGASVPVTVHWLPSTCEEHFLRFDASFDSLTGLRILARTELPPVLGACPASGACECETNTFTVQVPESGTIPLTVSGLYGAIQIALGAGPLPPGPEHVIELIRRGTGQPLAGYEIEYIPGSYPTPPMMVLTDAEGRVVIPSACSADSTLGTSLYRQDPGWGCGEDFLRFEGALRPCGRALRTILLNGPKLPPPDASAPLTRERNGRSFGAQFPK